MRAIAALRALGPVDLRNVGRDPLLRWLILVPFGFALLVRAVMPPLMQRLSGWIEFDLMPHYVPLMTYLMLVMMPNIAGAVVGFLLLDQRDDQTLAAVRVTPLSLEGYLIYRLSIPMLISFLITPLVIPVAGLPLQPIVPLLLACATAVPFSAVFAVFLAAFARNKVQGFALMKVTGIVLWPPLIAYFTPMPWQLLAGLLPTYWPGKLYWTASAGLPHHAVYLVVGLIYQGLLLWLLLRRYRRVIA